MTSSRNDFSPIRPDFINSLCTVVMVCHILPLHTFYSFLVKKCIRTTWILWILSIFSKKFPSIFLEGIFSKSYVQTSPHHSTVLLACSPGTPLSTLPCSVDRPLHWQTTCISPSNQYNHNATCIPSVNT